MIDNTGYQMNYFSHIFVVKYALMFKKTIEDRTAHLQSFFQEIQHIFS